MGHEQFKSKIEENIEKALPEQELNDLGKEKKEKAEKANAVRGKLKDAIKKGFEKTDAAKDLAVTTKEKIAIYNIVKAAVPQSTLKKFGIKDYRGLMRLVKIGGIKEQKKYNYYKVQAKSSPGVVFKDFKKLVDDPWSKSVLEQAAKNGSEYAFHFSGRMLDHPKVARHFLLIAAASKPHLAFHYIQNYSKLPDASDVLLSAVNKMDSPKIAFKFIAKYKDVPGAANVLKFAAQKKPEFAKRYLIHYRKEEFASEVLAYGITNAKDAEDIYKNMDDYSDMQDFDVLLAQIAMKYNADLPVKYIKKLKDNPNIVNILMACVSTMTEHEAILNNVELLKKHDNLGGLLYLMASSMQNPGAILDATGILADVKGIEKTFVLAAQLKPKAVIDNLDMLASCSELDISSVFISAARSNPALIFKKFDNLSKVKDSNKIFIAAAEADSYQALVFAKNNAKLDAKLKAEIVQAAFDNIGPKHFMQEKFKRDFGGLFTRNQKKQLFKNIKEFGEISKDMLKNNKALKNAGSAKKKAKLEGFAQDDSLQHILKVKSDWIPKDLKINRTEARVLVARNLYEDGIPVTEQSVQHELQQILKDREAKANIPIYKDRNVLYVSSTDEHEDLSGSHRVFGKDTEYDAIRKQGGKLDEDLVKNKADIDKDTPQDMLRKRDRILVKIVTTKPPLTFHYSGHGGKDALYIHQHPDVKLTAVAISKALIQRYNYWKNKGDLGLIEKKNPPILVIGSCYSANMVKKIYKKMENKEGRPIALGAAEIGQEGMANKADKKFSSAFEGKVIGLGFKGKISTLGTVMRNQDQGDSNAFLHIPNPKGGKRSLM